ETVLRALHPYAPFITEELWQRAPRPSSRPKSIAVAPYPTGDDARTDPEAEHAFAIVMNAIGAARATRSEHEVHPGDQVPLELRTGDPKARDVLSAESTLIRFLVKTEGAPIVAAPGGA